MLVPSPLDIYMLLYNGGYHTQNKLQEEEQPTSQPTEKLYAFSISLLSYCNTQ
eukprot:gene1633-1002_t